MKKITLFFVWVIFQILDADLCMAQDQHKVDSLITVIKTAKSDTSRFYAYANIIYEYTLVGNFEKAKAYGDTALLIGKKLSFSKDINIDRAVRIGMAKSYINIGIIYYDQYQYQQASEVNFKALSYVEGEKYNSADEKKMTAKIYHNLGIDYRAQEKHDSAILCLLRSLRITEQSGDKMATADNYLSIGLVYSDKSDYPKSIEYYFRCLSIAKETNDNNLLFSIFNNIGLNYYNQNNFTKALDYFQQGLKIAEMIKTKTSLFRSYNNLGITYNDLRDYPKALNFYTKALNVARELGDKQSMLMVYNNIGTVYTDISRLPNDSINELRKNWSFPAHGNVQQVLLDSAIANHSHSLELSLALNNAQGKIFNLKGIGVAYSDKKDYNKAIYFSKQAAQIAEQIGHSKDLMYISMDLAYSYQKKGDYKNAFLSDKKYFSLKDSIYGEEQEREIGRQEQKYESEKQIAILNKDKQIQNAEIKKQKLIRNFFIGGVALLLLLSILFYNYYRTKQLLKLQTLRNHIASDLHDDVGSTLSSISIFSELAKQQSKEVIPMLESISDSSQKMLESMADIVWTINPENDNFEKIILRMRSFAYELLGAKKIDFEFNADDTVTKMKLAMDVRKNLYLIFKEATNNMVKYAGANRAFFSITGSKNNLTMLIRDNGKGFDINQASQGNGLKNMKKRAEEIGGSLLIESAPGTGTTIQLLIKAA